MSRAGCVWMSVIAKELHTHTKLAETGSVVVASLSRISDEARQSGVLRTGERRVQEGHTPAKSFITAATFYFKYKLKDG